MTNSTSGIGGVPAMSYLYTNPNKEVVKAKLTQAEQQLLDAYERISKLSAKSNIQQALESSLNTIRNQFSAILGIKYSENADEILDSLSTDELNMIIGQINGVQEEIDAINAKINSYDIDLAKSVADVETYTAQKLSTESSIAAKQQLLEGKKADLDRLNTQIDTLKNDPAYKNAVDNLNTANTNVYLLEQQIDGLSNAASFNDVSQMNLTISAADQSKISAGQQAVNMISSLLNSIQANGLAPNAPAGFKTSFANRTTAWNNYVNDNRIGTPNADQIQDLVQFLQSNNMFFVGVGQDSYNQIVSSPGYAQQAIDGMNIQTTYVLNYLKPKLVEAQALVSQYQATFNTLNASVLALEQQKAPILTEITDLNSQITDLNNILNNTILPKLNAAIAEKSRIAGLIEAETAKLDSLNDELTSLIQKKEAAQTTYDNAKSFFLNTLTETEQKLFRLLYPNEVFPF